MAVARKMPSDLGRTVKKAAPKKAAVKKVSGLKYAATKKPNNPKYPSETLGTKKYMSEYAKATVAQKNKNSNRVRDTKPTVRNGGPRRRAL
jgi:hypothetical protein